MAIFIEFLLFSEIIFFKQVNVTKYQSERLIEPNGFVFADYKSIYFSTEIIIRLIRYLALSIIFWVNNKLHEFVPDQAVLFNGLSNHSKNDYRLYIPPIVRAKLSKRPIHKGDPLFTTNQLKKPGGNAFIIRRKPIIDDEAYISKEKESFPYAGSLIMARFFFIYFYLCFVSSHIMLKLRAKTSWWPAMVPFITINETSLMPWRVRLENMGKKSYFNFFVARSYKIEKVRAVCQITSHCCTHHKKHLGGGVLYTAESVHVEDLIAFLSRHFISISISLVWFQQKSFMWACRPVIQDVTSLSHLGKIYRMNGNGRLSGRAVFYISFYNTKPSTYAVHAEGDCFSLLIETIPPTIVNHPCVYRSFFNSLVKHYITITQRCVQTASVSMGASIKMIPHAHTLLLVFAHLLIIYFITSIVSKLTINNKKTNSPTAPCECNRALRIPRWELESLPSVILSRKYEINTISPIKIERVVCSRYVSQSIIGNKTNHESPFINWLSILLSFYRYRIKPPEFTQRSDFRGCGYF